MRRESSFKEFLLGLAASMELHETEATRGGRHRDTRQRREGKTGKSCNPLIEMPFPRSNQGAIPRKSTKCSKHRQPFEPAQRVPPPFKSERLVSFAPTRILPLELTMPMCTLSRTCLDFCHHPTPNETRQLNSFRRLLRQKSSSSSSCPKPEAALPAAMQQQALTDPRCRKMLSEICMRAADGKRVQEM